MYKIALKFNGHVLVAYILKMKSFVLNISDDTFQSKIFNIIQQVVKIIQSEIPSAIF